MKTTICCIAPALFTFSTLFAEVVPDYRNFLRQVQLPSGVTMDVQRPSASHGDGELSPLGVSSGGARFELYSVHKTTLAEYKLASTNVGVRVPKATMVIDTQDPYGRLAPEKEVPEKGIYIVSFENPGFDTATIKKLPSNSPSYTRRTRADKPFKVYVSASGITPAVSDPDSLKKVNVTRKVLDYGASASGVGVNQSQATLCALSVPQSLMNLPDSRLITRTEIPNAVPYKERGEEIFSVWTLNDTTIPTQPVAPKLLATQRVQVWPMTSASMSGISMDQKTRFAVPTVTFRYTDTYPLSTTFAQVYKGERRGDVTIIEEGVVGGSSIVNTTEQSMSYLQTSAVDFDSLFTSDGRWTMEVLTKSTFDVLRLTSVTFTVDRSIEVNGTFTTIE